MKEMRQRNDVEKVKEGCKRREGHGARAGRKRRNIRKRAQSMRC